MTDENNETKFFLFYTEQDGEVWFGVLPIYDFTQWIRSLAEHKFMCYQLLRLDEAQKTGTDLQPYWISPQQMGSKDGKEFFKVHVPHTALTKARYGMELKATMIPFGKSPLTLRFTTMYWARQSGDKLVQDALDMFESHTSGSS